ALKEIVPWFLWCCYGCAGVSFQWWLPVDLLDWKQAKGRNRFRLGFLGFHESDAF
ncbi:hypothetical protein U1Q18_017736, partial [Sarracenia purpurea var. burkii]